MDWHPGERCPVCDSPSPELHPAVQHEGEVQPCKDAFHSRLRPCDKGYGRGPGGQGREDDRMADSKRDETMVEVERLAVLLNIAARMADGLWDDKPHQQKARFRIKAAIEEAEEGVRSYRLARMRMD